MPIISKSRRFSPLWFMPVAMATALLLGMALTAPLSSQSSLKPAALEDFDKASIQQGEYLARVGNCASCHTRTDDNPYAGGVEFHTPFGLLHSTNITPDPETGIGAWDFADFYHSMKQGVRPDGTHLYPAFPYTDFAKLTDEDLASLYLYLQNLEPVEQANINNQLAFPFSQRMLLAGWKWLFHDPSTYQANPAQSVEWNRGAYLVEGAGHCGACHSPRNLLGAEQEALALTGGVYQDQILFGYHRAWSGVNLTSHKTGLASWSHEGLVDYLQQGISEHAVVHGPMQEVVMNSTRHLTTTDLQAMAVYILSLPAKAQPMGTAADEPTLAAGELVYTVHCGSCHLPTGKGEAGLGISLAGNPIVQAPDPSSLINVILYGPHIPTGLVVDRSCMKMFGKRLSDTDIAQVASYVRASFGNQAGAVSPEQVRIQR